MGLILCYFLVWTGISQIIPIQLEEMANGEKAPARYKNGASHAKNGVTQQKPLTLDIEGPTITSCSRQT